MPMTTRSSSVVRSSSPTTSESSDMYYDNDAFPTSPGSAVDCDWNLSDAPGSDAAAEDVRDTTPTPRPARDQSPASVAELPMEDFPPLVAPTPAAPTARNKSGKKEKGKKRAIQQVVGEDDPHLAADIALATAASLGLPTVLDHATPGASASRSGPASPSKRLRTNAVGGAASDMGQSPFLLPVETDVAGVNAGHAETPEAGATSPASAPNRNPASAAQVVTASSTNPPAVTTAAPPAPSATIAASTAPAPAAHATTASHLEPVAAAPTLAATAHAGGAGSYAAAAAAAPAAAVVPNMPPAPAAAVQRIANNAAAAPAGTAWRTQDGNPPRGSYVPTPYGGFPAFVYSHTLLTQGMPATLMPLYDEVPHPKFFIVVSGGNGATIQTHGLIRVTIGDLLNVDPTSFHLGTPPATASGPSQVLWLVAGLPPHLAQAVIDQQVVSTSRITLFVIPYDMPVIGYVGTFGGFTLPNSQGGADAARDLLQAAIRTDREIAQFVQTHRDAFGPHISAEQAWDIFSNSVAVEGIELLVNNTTTVAWHLHVTPPTNDNGAWLQLRRLFGRLCVMTALHGTARLQRSYRCRICPSITHPTGLCPLPRLPGWLGPTPATIAALEDASRQAATRAQDHIRGNAEAGSSAAPRAGANRGPGTAAAAKKPRKDLGKTKKGGDPKGKGKRREHDDFF
ncbi:hypothetical protein DFH08DRAFT_327270 [Mycena albidolilacea]|uniref:Uncharacterized protein n=1 Tax=Mycena albidolilacea TaxID=1033008 RepID=A0AAD6ZCV3_9AGAR|nr:hypothetical protein DFH08DRAFT_420115 [Mycena albidolilacea]KAJ7362857.1 hypothetical protein DFH08DRAFT_327270 [Mycena albidolilacea]